MLKKLSKWLNAINIVDVLKFVIKILVTIRWGYDTYEVSVNQGALWYIALFNVIVIDAIFIVFWLLASSDSQRDNIKYMKVPAAIGAWVMVGGMLYIAEEIGQGTTLVARVGGLLFLAFDTYGIMSSSIRSVIHSYKVSREERLQKEARESVEQRRQRVRDQAWKAVYAMGVRTVGVMIIALRSVGLIGDDINEDLEIIRFKRDNARTLRRAQSGLEVSEKIRVDGDPFEITQNSDGTFGWRCSLCNQESSRSYRSRGAAKFGWTSHSRKSGPSHNIEM